MAISGYFFNALRSGDTYDRTYNAEDVTSYLDNIVGDGVFPTPATQLQVMAAGGMGIIVQAGQGWIDGHKMVNTAALPLTIGASDVLLNRIDRVVFYVDHDEREMGIEVKRGALSAAPSAPDLVRNADRWEMGLATVYVANGSTAIRQADITDTRGDSTVCGWVAGLIKQIDTTTLWNQWNDAGRQAMSANQAEWSDWFDQVKEEFASATLLQRLEGGFSTSDEALGTFDVTDYVPRFKYSIDVLEVYVSGLRLDADEYTRAGSTVTLATPITHAGTKVDLVVYKSIGSSDAETIVEQVEEMRSTVDTLATGTYVATGTNDNKKLSAVVQAFLNGGDDHRQLEIDVYGTLAIAEPASTADGDSYWFDFSGSGSTTRRVIIDFADCGRLRIDNTGTDNARFARATGSVEIRNAHVDMTDCDNAQLIEGDSTCADCAFWMAEADGGTGDLVGATRGRFDNCRMTVAGGSGKAYGFSADGGFLRLTNTEVIAHNKDDSSEGSVAVHAGTQASNVLLMTNCRCPTVSQPGYKQDDSVRIDGGSYALVGNVLGTAAVKYATGDNKTEIATIVS